VCNAGFHFDYTLVACTVYQNCTGLANSPGTNFNSLTCNCNSGFVIDTTSNVCVRNCSNIQHSVDQLDPTTCTCAPGYYFNNSTTICVLNCSSMIYSTGATSGTGCQCKSNYRFDSITGQCIAKTSSSHAVAIAVGIAVPLGVLVLICLIALLLLSGSAAQPVVAPIPFIAPLPVMAPVPVVQSTIVRPQVINPVRILPNNMTSTTRILPSQPIIGRPF
jgi:hypothetical protein